MQDVRGWLDALRTRVLMLAVRGIVHLVGYPKEPGIDEEGLADKGAVQLLQFEALKGEVISGAEHPQPYGFASRVKNGKGAECIALCPGGDRARAVVLVVYSRKVGIKLKPGEVAIFDDVGQEVRLRQDGRVIVRANTEMRLHAPELQVYAPKLQMMDGGNIHTAGTVQGGLVEGNIVKDQNPTTPSLQGMRALFNLHTHSGSSPPDQQM